MNLFNSTRYDVVVVGGGPSGSTLAHLVAERGHRVLVLERERFPRFRIGESLLPCDLEVFDRLGLRFEDGGPHLYKAGAEFYREAEGEHAEYPFSDSLPGTPDHAWQVDRAHFDKELLDGAAEVGADVHYGEGVTEVSTDAEEVVVRTARGSYRARFLIDASGQASLLARRHGTRERIDEFGRAAIFGHYRDLRPAIADELAERGNVKIFTVEDGWNWMIPLGQGRMSIGHVTRHKGVKDDWLDHQVSQSPELSRLTEGARRDAKPRTMASFSFFNTKSHGVRWACVGDAATFLDPVFSTGVSFGMMAAADIADTLSDALEAGREGQAGLLDAHAAHMAHGYSVFATLIRALYQRRLLPGLFFTKDQDPVLRAGLTTVLAGDVWRDDNPFQERLWGSKRRRFEVAPSLAAR